MRHFYVWSSSCMNHQLKQFYVFPYFSIKCTYIIVYCQSRTWSNRGTPNFLYMYVEMYSVYWYLGQIMSSLIIKMFQGPPNDIKLIFWKTNVWISTFFYKKNSICSFLVGIFCCCFFNLFFLCLVDDRSWQLFTIIFGMKLSSYNYSF